MTRLLKIISMLHRGRFMPKSPAIAMILGLLMLTSNQALAFTMIGPQIGEDYTVSAPGGRYGLRQWVFAPSPPARPRYKTEILVGKRSIFVPVRVSFFAYAVAAFAFCIPLAFCYAKSRSGPDRPTGSIDAETEAE